LMEDTLAFLRLPGAPLRYRDAVCDPALEPERISVAEAFRTHVGIDLLATLTPSGAGPRYHP
jgi:lysyl-tRNA synthetase class 2